MTLQFKVHMAKDVGATVADALDKIDGDPVMEPKYDGWRCVVIRVPEGVRFFNRSQKEYTGKLPELEREWAKLPEGTILDGEIVAMRYDPANDRWENDFFRIHTVMRSLSSTSEQRDGIRFIAFDCLRLGHSDVHDAELPNRRRCVRGLINEYGLRLTSLTEQMAPTQENHDALVAAGFEGTVIKDQRAPYAYGKRGHGWFKIKDVTTIDCVIMYVVIDGKGQYEGQAGRMIVGQYKPCPTSPHYDNSCDEPGCDDGVILTRVASVNCLDQAQRRAVTDDPSAFVGRVIEVKIYGWTVDGPRHPTPMRFRDDKEPHECVWSDR